mmetsp:Transcript_100104/g.321040  ORF Transcript_100104/g.321040 Transcript_100104/m.321040 type:complete len:216 (-) Transcript_100104:1168-1815(-)
MQRQPGSACHARGSIFEAPCLFVQHESAGTRERTLRVAKVRSREHGLLTRDHRRFSEEGRCMRGASAGTKHRQWPVRSADLPRWPRSAVASVVDGTTCQRVSRIFRPATHIDGALRLAAIWRKPGAAGSVECSDREGPQLPEGLEAPQCDCGIVRIAAMRGHWSLTSAFGGSGATVCAHSGADGQPGHLDGVFWSAELPRGPGSLRRARRAQAER